MDIRCTRCGEPWDTDYVFHDDPKAFKRHGACITSCPCCPKGKRLSKRRKRIADAAAVIADLCGDDVDAAASMMDELGEMEL